jgi:potassium-dependent mechanosensitive channel
MVDTILQYLRTPLVVLGGTPVTTLTLLAAIAIVIVSRIIAAIIGRSVERVLESRGLDKGMRFAAGKITRYVILILGVFVALGTMGVDTSAVMAGGAVLLVGIGFGLQKLAENFISGLLLLIERPVRKGDFIDVAGVLGTVDDIGLRATRVISRDGVTVIVPNSNLISATVINHSVPTASRRIWINLGVAYDTELDHAVRVLCEIAAAEPMVQTEPAPEVRHLGFGDYAIQLGLVCWIHDARDEAIVSSKLRFSIDHAFRTAKIVIPIPQREIHMRGPA